MDLQAAADYIGVQFHREVENFIADKALLPSWGPEVDANVAACVEALENWTTGLLEFTCESERYLTPQERVTRVVTLREPEALLVQLSRM